MATVSIMQSISIEAAGSRSAAEVLGDQVETTWTKELSTLTAEGHLVRIKAFPIEADSRCVIEVFGDDIAEEDDLKERVESLITPLATMKDISG